jgi:adenylate kinase
LASPHIDLSKYSFDHGLVSSEDKLRETHIVDMDKLRQEVTRVVEASEDYVILDGHYAQDLVSESLVSKVLVLRKAPWFLRHDLERRGYSRGKVLENLEAEIMGICLNESLTLFPAEKVCEIDTTNNTKEKTLDEAINLLNNHNGCDRERIDWLTSEETLNLLREANVHNR